MQARLTTLMGRLPHSEADELRTDLDTMLASLRTTEFRLRPDGTFDADMTLHGETSTLRGTWQIDGDQLTLLQTHQDGLPSRDTLNGICHGPTIHLTEQPDSDLAVVLRRV